MKKLYFMLLTLFMVSIAFGISSCNSCSGSENENEESEKIDTTENVKKAVALNFEHVIATDRQEVYCELEGKNYRWFEATADLKYFLDSEEACDSIEGITTVFQWVEDNEFDPHVIMIYHNALGENQKVYPPGFYVGNDPLEEEKIKITFSEAFNILMKANCPKPHSKKCVLRKIVGKASKVTANPQYIFGNKKAQVFVDAITGEITEINPEVKDSLNMPLGEWP